MPFRVWVLGGFSVRRPAPVKRRGVMAARARDLHRGCSGALLLDPPPTRTCSPHRTGLLARHIVCSRCCSLGPASVGRQRVHRTATAAAVPALQAKELDTNTDYYLDLLSKGVGKPKEELAEFLRGPRYFRAQEAINYRQLG